MTLIGAFAVAFLVGLIFVSSGSLQSCKSKCCSAFSCLLVAL